MGGRAEGLACAEFNECCVINLKMTSIHTTQEIEYFHFLIKDQNEKDYEMHYRGPKAICDLK